MRQLKNAGDWRGLAGDDKWVVGRSAYELAHAWHNAGGLPVVVSDAFRQSGHVALAEISLEVAFVEKPVFLDTLVGPSMNDIMAYGRNRAHEPVVLAIEGKADEAFGLPISSWLRGDRLNPRPEDEPRKSRLRRLAFLSQQLGLRISIDSTIRYQLTHRTTSALLEGALHGAAATVVIVHSFSEQDAGNWEDYSHFLIALGCGEPKKNEVSHPVQLPGGKTTPLFFLWIADKPRVALNTGDKALQEDVRFDFLCADEPSMSLNGSVRIGEDAMVLQVEWPGDRPYLIVGRPITSYYSGRHEGMEDDVPVTARWTQVGREYVGIWIEDGKDYLFRFALRTPLRT